MPQKCLLLLLPAVPETHLAIRTYLLEEMRPSWVLWARAAGLVGGSTEADACQPSWPSSEAPRAAAGSWHFFRCYKYEWRLGLVTDGGKGQSRGQTQEPMGHLGRPLSYHGSNCSDQKVWEL